MGTANSPWVEDSPEKEKEFERWETEASRWLLSPEKKLREAQQLDANHSLQWPAPLSWRMVNPSTEITTVEQISLVQPFQLPRPAVERRLPGHRRHVKWPDAADKKLWQTVNTVLTLEQLQGTPEKKLERRGDIIYQYGAECFGIQEVKSAKKSFESLTKNSHQFCFFMKTWMRKKQWPTFKEHSFFIFFHLYTHIHVSTLQVPEDSLLSRREAKL